MKRAPSIMLMTAAVLMTAMIARAEEVPCDVRIIGAGPMVMTLPRCLRAAPSGQVYLLQGKNGITQGCLLRADYTGVELFGDNGRTAEAGKWFHPASFHPTKRGDLLVADTGNHRVLLLDREGNFKKVVIPEDKSTDGLVGPTDAVELPGGDIVVCDSTASKLVLYGADGKRKRVIAQAGSGPDEVKYPFSLGVDSDGDLCVVDTLNRRLVERGGDLAVKRVIKPVTPDGPVMSYPSFIDFDSTGNILVADAGAGCIFRFSDDGKLLTRIGQVEGKPKPFANVSGVAVTPGGEILACDADRNCVYRFNSKGDLLGVIGKPRWKNKRVGRKSLAVGVDGSIFELIGSEMCLVRRFDRSGIARGEFGGYGVQPGKFLRPMDMARGPAGNLFIADSENHRVTVFRPDGIQLRIFGKVGKGKSDFHYPRTIAVSSSGLVYVGDAGNQRVQVYTSEGKFVKTFCRDVNPTHIDVDRSGRCLVHDGAEQVVIVYDPKGHEISRISLAKSKWVVGAIFSGDGNVWVLDSGAGIIRKLTPQGKEAGILKDSNYRNAWNITRGGDGRVYVNHFNGVYPISSDGKVLPAIALRPRVTPGKLQSPAAVALVWNDRLVALEEETGALQVFTRDGAFEGLLKTDKTVGHISHILADAGGDLNLLDSSSGRLLKVKRDGKVETVASGKMLGGAGSIVRGPKGSLFLLKENREGIVKYDSAGKELGVLKRGDGENEFRWPKAFTVSPGGDVLVTDWRGGRLFCYDNDLKFKWVFSSRSEDVRRHLWGDGSAMTTDRDGNMYFLAAQMNAVVKFGPDRKYVSTMKLDGKRYGRMLEPSGLSVDKNGKIFVADTGGNRIIRLSPKQ